MKIIDGIKQEGKPFEIPDCTRDDLPEFFKEMGYKVGVEIGVERGDYSEIICKSGLKLYVVDPWLEYADAGIPTRQQKHDNFYEVAKERLSKYDCTIIKKVSMEALNDIADESLDFVYIDGNHSFKYVVEDIWGWSKKIRLGGIISGHDYYNRDKLHQCDVKYAVDAYIKACQIPKWYVLGKESEGRRDKYRSWFWIK